MKKGTVIVCMMLIIQMAFAQLDVKTVELDEVRKINILYPGYEVEKPLKGKLSWGYMLGTHLWFQASQHYQSDGSYGFGFDYVDLAPTAEVFGRWYYNMQRRTNKRKRVQNNSASYFTAGASVFVDGIRIVGDDFVNDDHIYSGLYIGWGLRRTFGRRIIFDMHLKFQPTLEDDSYYGLAVLPGIRLSYLLSRRK